MSKKKLSQVEQKIKKTGLIAKKYTDDQVLASQLKKYEKATPNTGYLKTIILSAAANATDAAADQNRIEIDIPKDFLVKSGKMLTVVAGTGDNVGKFMVTEEDGAAVATPYEAPSAVDAAGQWIDLVINTKENDETASHLVFNVSKLVDVYTAGNGLNLNNGVFSIKLKQVNSADASGLEVTSDGLAIKIDSSNANGLAITAAGLKLALAVASTNGAGGSAGAMSAADKEKLNKALTSDDIALLSDAEIGSWFGYSAVETAAILNDFSDDSITDEE